MTATWMGTNDTGATDSSPGGTGSPNNMLMVRQNQYDGGGVGDGTLTQSTQFPDTTVTHERVTLNYYDWRDRLVASKAGALVNSSGVLNPSGETDSVHRPITYCSLDNLGRCLTRSQYDGDGVSITTTSGVPVAPSSSILRKQMTTGYDDQDRPYLSEVFDVNQTSGGTPTYYLATNSFYDHRGNAIESAPPGAPVGKKIYDGAGRLSEQYVTDGSAGTTWAVAGTVTGDNVLQSVQYTYDGDGNAVMTTSKQRFNDTTAAGELGTSSADAKAWVSFSTAYFDQANRAVANVQLGRVSGDSYTAPVPSGGVPPTPPTRSDTVLVTSMTYNSAGWVSAITDPKALKTAKAYDSMGRVTQQVEAWDGSTSLPISASSVASAGNRATNYVYDGSSHTYQLTAVMPSGTNSQTTQYNYGVGSGGQLYSNDLLGSVQYPSRTAGTAGTTAADKQTYTYDFLGETLTMVDQNQTTHTYAYDLLSRRTMDSVAVYSGNPMKVDTSMLSQTINFDTGGRPYQMTSYTGATGGGSVWNQVQMAYNGFGQLTAEYQSHVGTVSTSTSPATSYAYTETSSGTVNNSRLTGITYPNGRVVYYNYNDAGDTAGISNAISRVNAICKNSTRGAGDMNVLAGYTYMGLSAPVVKSYVTALTGMSLWGGTTGSYPGLDSFMRTANQDWQTFASGPLPDVFKIAYGYDRDSNRVYASNVTQPATGVDPPYTGSSHVYTYDNLNRLTQDARGLIASGNGSIQSYWQTMNDNWSLDTLGNQLTSSAGSSNSSMVTNTPDSINEYTANTGSSNGYLGELSASDSLSSNTNWSLPSGSSATFSVASGKLTISTVTTDTFGSYTESEARAVVLWGASVGPDWSGANVTFPSGATSGQAGWVFGYKGSNDYWVRVYDLDQHVKVYHVVNGSKTLITSVSQSVSTGTDYSLTVTALNDWVSYPFNCTFSNGYPGGKVGVYSNLAGVSFDSPSVYDNPRPFPLYGRWEGTSYYANAGGVILQNAASGVQGPMYLQNERLQKFQATFAVGCYNGGSYNAAQLVFNGKDRGDYDLLYFQFYPAATTVSGYISTNGNNLYSMSGTFSSGPANPSYAAVWCRVQFDGTTLKAWQILASGSSPPTETAWASATQVVSSTGCRTTGGKIGFMNTFGGIPTNVNSLTLKSYDTSTGAYDITEATDSFTIDGSNNGNNTLASDSNGNQTYDGSQVYTYDGWNRLISVSHGYRDSSGNLQHGQAAATMSYDSKGRRISKAVINTGSWDCTYNYYYNGNQQIEQRNGSNQTIRQNVWGLQYIDELIQTSLNSSPTSQSTCDTPYWALQDANWNVLGIVNSSGVLQERYEYSPYGQRTVYFSPGSNDPFCTAPTVGSQRFVASGSVTEPWGLCEFGHQGLMHDEECGLIYNRARYLSPMLGRFLQEDPAGYTDVLNLYNYCKLVPNLLHDPKGLWPSGYPEPPAGWQNILPIVDTATGGLITGIWGGLPVYEGDDEAQFGPNSTAYIEQNAQIDNIWDLAFDYSPDFSVTPACCGSNFTLKLSGQANWKITRIGSNLNSMSNLTGGSVDADFTAVCFVTSKRVGSCCQKTVRCVVGAQIAKNYNFDNKGLGPITQRINIYGQVMFSRTQTRKLCP